MILFLKTPKHLYGQCKLLLRIFGIQLLCPGRVNTEKLGYRDTHGYVGGIQVNEYLLTFFQQQRVGGTLIVFIPLTANFNLRK